MRAKDPWEIQLMRQSGGRLAEVAALLREAVRPGVTTRELDEVAAKGIRDRGGLPSFLGYTAGGNTPFPATICASPNEVVVHGIPTDKPLRDGDIVSLDVGMIYAGYHSDHAFTVAVGEVGPEARRLLEVTERALYLAIASAVAGNRIGDIGHAVERHVHPHGFGIVREYVGHGIGRAMHERPSVPNYGPPNQGSLLKTGFCLAIEPMINLGGEGTRVLKDGWTVVTKDKSLSAHFEHTIAITERGPQVLTALDGGVVAATV